LARWPERPQMAYQWPERQRFVALPGAGHRRQRPAPWIGDRV